MSVDFTFTCLRQLMMTEFALAAHDRNTPDHGEFFHQRRPVHVAAPGLLDLHGHDHRSEHSTLREKKVLPLVIESEIERLVPGGSAERLTRIVHRRQLVAGPHRSRCLATSALAASENIEAVQTRARLNWFGSSAG